MTPRQIAKCLGKEAFSSPAVAHKVRRRRSRLREKGKGAQEVYRCEVCGLFHIGQKSKSRHIAKQRFIEREDGFDMA